MRFHLPLVVLILITMFASTSAHAAASLSRMVDFYASLDDLTREDLSGLDFTGRDLSHRILVSVDLTDTILEGTDLTDTRLTGVVSGGITGTPAARLET